MHYPAGWIIMEKVASIGFTLDGFLFLVFVFLWGLVMSRSTQYVLCPFTHGAICKSEHNKK